MLREKLKEELDKLNEEQLRQVSDFVAFIEFKSKYVSSPFWQKATPLERVREFREWISQLPKSNVSLSEEALSRDSIYGDDEISARY